MDDKLTLKIKVESEVKVDLGKMIRSGDNWLDENQMVELIESNDPDSLMQLVKELPGDLHSLMHSIESDITKINTDSKSISIEVGDIELISNVESNE